MPYYDFVCETQHITEKRLSFNEYDKLEGNFEGTKIAKCETCNKPAIRVLSRPASMRMNYPNHDRNG